MQYCSGSSTVQTILVAQASTNKMIVSVRYVHYSKLWCVAVLLQVSKPPRPPQPSTNPSSSETQSPLQDVRHMSSEERSQLEISLSRVEEVAVCLVFTDGSSQLRPAVVSYKHPLPTSGYVGEAFLLTIVWLGAPFFMTCKGHVQRVECMVWSDGLWLDNV